MSMVAVESKEDSEQTPTVTLKLQSSDGQIVAADMDAAFQSHLIRKMLTDLNFLDPSNRHMLTEPIPIANVDGETLKKLMEWCVANKDKEWKPKRPSEDPIISLTQEDREYLDVGADLLMKMMLAANYLDIEPIVDIIAQKIANLAHGKTVEEIRQIYGLTNDFGPGEEKEIRSRYAWLGEIL